MFLTPVVNMLQTIVNKKADKLTHEVSDWGELEAAYENQQSVIGYVDHQVQKGYMVRFGDVLGFAPRYQFDLCEYDDVPNTFLNTPIEFSILKLEVETEQLIVSRIEVVQKKYADVLAQYKKGDTATGTVTAVMDKLVTVDLAGLTCLVSRSEVSWEPFNETTEVITVGDVVAVKLLRVVPSKAYITASIKQLDNSCWENFIRDHEIGSEVNVTISNVTDFGYFVTYNNMLSGILHWSELSWRPKSKQKAMCYERGDCLQVKVSALDFAKQQVSFSLKAMKANPVNQVFENYKLGDSITGVIRSRTDFGLFIEIAENFNGLLHFSNLSWFTNSKNNLVNFRAGATVHCKIIEADEANGRVGLGLKQLAANPFSEHPSLQSQRKSTEFPRPVSIAVSSFFQANCHNQIVAQLNDIKHKMRQHIDLSIENIFFDEEPINLPDILVVLLSADYFESDLFESLRILLNTAGDTKPIIIPIVADSIENCEENFLTEMACLPADKKPLQQWRVKSAYWSSINKSLIKSIRYAGGLK
ncbi:MAG: S1 RNA-binding domain-containing protein [Leucothrix sp.]